MGFKFFLINNNHLFLDIALPLSNLITIIALPNHARSLVERIFYLRRIAILADSVPSSDEHSRRVVIYGVLQIDGSILH